VNYVSTKKKQDKKQEREEERELFTFFFGDCFYLIPYG